MDSIKDLYDYFMQEYDKNNTHTSVSTEFYQNAAAVNGLHYDMDLHYGTVEHNFVNIFLLWEEFLEQSFILYLCGKPDLQGKSYISYGNPIDYNHAYLMIKGTKKYPDWTNVSEINCLSKVFFENSGPYQFLAATPVDLTDMKLIRNRISHMSTNSEAAFNRLLSKTISRSVGISVAEFLLTIKEGSKTYYTYYVETLAGYVDMICNK